MNDKARGYAYMVVSEDDLTTGKTMPLNGFEIELVPARKLMKWRGKKFNVATVRASGRIISSSIQFSDKPEYTRSFRIYPPGL